jgi:hypothetical protein
VVGFVLVHWQEYGFCRREDVSTFNLVSKKCYKLCTTSAVCNDNAAKNYIS